MSPPWGLIGLGTSRTEGHAPTNCAYYGVIMNITSNWIILKSFQKAFKIFDAFLIVYCIGSTVNELLGWTRLKRI